MTRPLHISNINVVNQTTPVPQKGFSAVALIDTTAIVEKAVVNSTSTSYGDALNLGITNFIANGGESLYVAGAVYDGVDTAPIEALIIDLVDNDDVYHFSFIVEKANQAQLIFDAINQLAISKKIMVTTEINGTVAEILAIADLYNSERLAFVARKESDFGGYALGILGNSVEYTPGTATFSNKLMKNILPSTFSTTELQQLIDGDIIVILNDRGYTICRETRTTASTFIDITTSLDYIEYRANMDITTLVINRKKLAYTDSDLALIGQTLDLLGQELVGLNILSAYKSVVPEASTISNTDKSNRVLNNVGFEVTLSGSVESIFIELTAKL